VHYAQRRFFYAGAVRRIVTFANTFIRNHESEAIGCGVILLSRGSTQKAARPAGRSRGNRRCMSSMMPASSAVRPARRAGHGLTTRPTFPARCGADGNQVISVTAVISSANRAQGIFWRISAVSLPIRSWYVCLCVPGGAFR
jgi:hypothetical protein